MLILVWYGLYICPTKPIYGSWTKEKVRMDVELGDSYLDTITELITIMRFWFSPHR